MPFMICVCDEYASNTTKPQEMATLIKHQETGQIYLLIGSGFGMFQSTKPNALFGDWLADKETGHIKKICACDEFGKIHWFDAEHVNVIEIDGKSPTAYFPASQ